MLNCSNYYSKIRLKRTVRNRRILVFTTAFAKTNWVDLQIEIEIWDKKIV